MPYQLPPLPYDYSALEPTIDTQTMQLHHDKHHAAYVTNANGALEKHPDLEKKFPTVEELLRNINQVPEDVRTVLRNNAGGHANHTMFWTIMQPKGGGAASGPVSEAVNNTFGGFDKFVEEFNTAGTKHFGSGWVWLVRGTDRKLQIITTPNQDSPFMQGLYPIMGNDLWEHAYYLKYQNRRPDYLKAWWNVVNWKEVNKRFEESESHLKKAVA
ncbi:MAG TPA: superoxide dismutase [Terriglobales bacterium]|nr:superoxide dismutase [Terriglobales bacterium]